jgi:hypothetical protein
MINNIFEDIQMVEQPKELKVQLYQHQLASIYKMEKREEEQIVKSNNTVIETNISVNADKTGYGKCHGYDTPIIMFDGTIKMVQNIRIGELLMGDDSTPRKVMSLAKGQEQMYKISQNIGDDYIVNESHILSLLCFKHIEKEKTGVKVLWVDPHNFEFESESFNYETNDYNNEKILREATNFFESIPNNTKVDICLKNYLKLSTDVQKLLKGYKSSVNCWENKLEKNDLDPYFIGLWLSDKSFDGFITKEIANALRKHNLINNKHIPLVYKINTRENRLKLLAGLIDSDGFCKKDKYKIIQKPNNLSKDIKFLCASLGFIYTSNKSYMSISGPNLHDIPVLKKSVGSITSDQNQTEIYVHPLGVDTYYGFSIDKNRRYLLGDFTVTHNTLAMATLVYRDKMKWDVSLPYQQSVVTTYAGGRIKKTVINNYEKLDVTLVLASQSIIHQWYEECQKTPLSVKMITSKKLVDTVMVENYDVILVTPTMFNRLVLKYHQIAWKRFIFDEPGHLKIPSMLSILAGFIWLVTATPNAIISQHRKCRSFMNDLICFAGSEPFTIQFDYMIIKNSDEFIEQSFAMPLPNHLYYKCYNAIYNTVNGFVSENITQMISAGNIQGAIKELGGGETHNIAELVRQKKLSEREELECKLLKYKTKNKTKQFDIVSVKIERIDVQLKELTGRYEEILKGDCSICFSTISNPVMEPNCQNIFCGECLLKWMETKKTCPLCRDSIQSNDLIYINTENRNQLSKKSEPTQSKTKINTVINLLKDNPDGKFIIFSDWDQTFLPIRTHLVNNNITFIEVKGCVSERQKNITNFKDGNIQVIFLNSRFNGAGINLQEATDIIVYHEMNDETLNQIIGRANRIGRLESLNVHHLQI